MASLALLASSEEQTSQRDREICHGSAQWLAAIEHSDGSLPVVAGPQFSGGWPTPLAVLLWSVLNGYQVQAGRRARSPGSSCAGAAISVDRSTREFVGHNTRLVGWPWVESTHSWLEPTAGAILGLCRLGLASHPRVTAGVGLILDRALDSGGWNYGNKSRLRDRATPATRHNGARSPARSRRQGAFAGGGARIELRPVSWWSLTSVRRFAVRWLFWG